MATQAAAMRYTEARLSPAGRLLMEGLDEDTVDFRETYDASEREPVVMPAGFPNLLANGAQGIAVGMSCSIPPHNLAEVCRALRHLLKSPKARHGSLMEFIPGPDFPTGGVIVSHLKPCLRFISQGVGKSVCGLGGRKSLNCAVRGGLLSMKFPTKVPEGAFDSPPSRTVRRKENRQL